jgi:hypothetical protein
MEGVGRAFEIQVFFLHIGIYGVRVTLTMGECHSSPDLGHAGPV